MQITELLAQMGGLRSIAKELGVDEAQVASGASALAPAILGGFKMMAMLVAGYIAKQKGAGPAVQRAPAGAPPGASTGGGLGGMLSEACLRAAEPARREQAPPSGGIASMLDLNGDGNALDDVLRMAGKR